MSTIPREEVHAIAARYNDHLWYHADPTADHVRGAADYRRRCGYDEGGDVGQLLLAEADDLDALADRYEHGEVTG
jgi:hypothetical protein